MRGPGLSAGLLLLAAALAACNPGSGAVGRGNSSGQSAAASSGGERSTAAGGSSSGASSGGSNTAGRASTAGTGSSAGSTSGGGTGATSAGTSGGSSSGVSSSGSGASVSSGGSIGGTSSGGSGGAFACSGDAGSSGCLGGDPCGLSDGGMGTFEQGSCLDLSSDPLNCGRPGVRCPNGAACWGGGCAYASCAGVAPAYYFVCELGEEQSCPLPAASDPFPYGCSLPDGGVQPSCCGGSCVDLWSDPNNCGACGIECTDGGCSSGNCVTGVVQPAGCSVVLRTACVTSACGADGAACSLDGGPGLCCGGSCLDSLFDPANCGGCGFACPAGDLCAYGTCFTPASCDAGFVVAWQFLYGTPLWWDTPVCSLDGGFGTCCAGACVDPRSDSQNCGFCGLACPLGSLCGVNGCVTDAGAEAYCEPDSGCGWGLECDLDACGVSSCAPPAADGQWCLTADYEGTCCSGQCADTLGECDPSFCSNLSSLANCGGCGFACGPASASCIRGVCQ
ncbi:MAG: hypothetical protein ACYDCL_21995 [Myxococcales bacterium]